MSLPKSERVKQTERKKIEEKIQELSKPKTSQAKTIKQVLYKLVNQEFVVTEEDVDKILPEIQSILDSAKPDKITNYADIEPPFDGQTDMSYLKGRAVGCNRGIDQYQSNINEVIQ